MATLPPKVKVAPVCGQGLASPTVLDDPTLFSGDQFPKELWYLLDDKSNRYGAFRVENRKLYPEPVNCLAVFRNAEQADDFAKMLDSISAIPYQTSFDEAREIAKAANKGFRALALMDSWDEPLLHFID